MYFPLYKSKKFNEQVLNVLLIKNENNESYYVLIKDFNRLMYSQIKTKNVYKKQFCMSCLQNVTVKEILNSHRERCLLINDIKKLNMKLEQLNLKTLINNYLYHLKFMRIQNVY